MMLFGYFFALAYLIVHTILKCVAGLLTLLTMVLKGICRVFNKWLSILLPVAMVKGFLCLPACFFPLESKFFEALFISYLIKLYFPYSKSLYLEGVRAYFFRTSEVYSETSEVFSGSSEVFSELLRFLANFQGL